MNLKRMLMLEEKGALNSFSGVDSILRQSSKATCGIMEREIRVKAKRVPEVKNRLRNAGFRIIGTSEPRGKMRTVWFIRLGGF